MEQQYVNIATEKRMTADEFFGVKFALTPDSQYEWDQAVAKLETTERRDNVIDVTTYRPGTVTFYTVTFIEDFGSERGKELTTLNEMTGFSMLNNTRFWKFGYVTPEGEIVFLFGGHHVADGRSQAFIFYEKVKQFMEAAEIAGQAFATK